MKAGVLSLLGSSKDDGGPPMCVAVAVPVSRDKKAAEGEEIRVVQGTLRSGRAVSRRLAISDVTEQKGARLKLGVVQVDAPVVEQTIVVRFSTPRKWQKDEDWQLKLKDPVASVKKWHRTHLPQEELRGIVSTLAVMVH